MQFNMFTNHLLELSTLPTFHNAYLPTLTFIYPTQNLSSLVDIHYNCNPPFHPLPVLFHAQTQPSTDASPKKLPLSLPPRTKLKKTRSRNEKKELESAKKNSESNLVNQLYSYFSNYQKSERVVEKAIKSLKTEGGQIQKIKTIFYNTVRLINFKRGRKYVNKESLLAYYTSSSCILNLEGIAAQLENLKLITVEQFCYLFRVYTHHFFKEVSLTAILTSKRITSVARNEHLKRRRRVLQSLYEHDLN